MQYICDFRVISAVLYCGQMFTWRKVGASGQSIVIASSCLLSFLCFLVSFPLPPELIPSALTSTPGPADLRDGNTCH